MYYGVEEHNIFMISNYVPSFQPSPFSGQGFGTIRWFVNTRIPSALSETCPTTLYAESTTYHVKRIERLLTLFKE